MTRVAIVVALALQACGPRNSEESERPGDSQSQAERETDEPVDAGPNCPARFDFAMQGSACPESGRHCVYPEAECWCTAKAPCMGAEPDPEQYTLEWACTVSDATVRRPDGCPARVPEQGHACEQDGQVCHYSPYCGGIASTGRCTGGSWQLQQVEVSAPPSSEN